VLAEISSPEQPDEKFVEASGIWVIPRKWTNSPTKIDQEKEKKAQIDC